VFYVFAINAVIVIVATAIIALITLIVMLFITESMYLFMFYVVVIFSEVLFLDYHLYYCHFR